MHARDVAEDILITYGYNTIEPVQVKIPAVGRKDELNTFCDKIADIMVGCGLQEILLYSLTNKNNLFGKMNMPEHQVAEIDNPTSENWSVFRTSLLPGLLEFFVRLKHTVTPKQNCKNRFHPQLSLFGLPLGRVRLRVPLRCERAR